VSRLVHIWRAGERIPDCRSCNAETAGGKQNADIWDEQQISIRQLKRMSGMISMQS